MSIKENPQPPKIPEILRLKVEADPTDITDPSSCSHNAAKPPLGRCLRDEDFS
jgi:hypothetical protein